MNLGNETATSLLGLPVSQLPCFRVCGKHSRLTLATGSPPSCVEATSWEWCRRHGVVTMSPASHGCVPSQAKNPFVAAHLFPSSAARAADQHARKVATILQPCGTYLKHFRTDPHLAAGVVYNPSGIGFFHACLTVEDMQYR